MLMEMCFPLVRKNFDLCFVVHRALCRPQATQVKDVLMRIQPWLKKTLAGVAMAFAAESPALAQNYAPGNPDGAYPPVFQAPYGNNDPGVMYPPGVPQSYQPWPAVSPFYSANIGTDQHTNQNGLWFQNQMYRRRDYYGSVEAMAVWFRDAGTARIGSPYMPIDPVTQTIAGYRFDSTTPGAFPVPPATFPVIPVGGSYPVDNRVYPFPALDNSVGAFNPVASAAAFKLHDAGSLGDPQAEPGVQLRWGFEDEDGTGLMANVWWAFEGGSQYSRGYEHMNGVRITQDVTLALAGTNLSSQYGNIPLFNGETISPLVGAGTTAKYDVLFSLSSSTEAGGTNLSYYLQPILGGDGFKVRPSLGARYLYLAEGFHFRGIDSGFNYSIDATVPGTGTGAGGGGGGGGAGTTANTFRPDSALVDLYDQYEANLSSSVVSHLAGPEIGLRFDLGESRDGFRVWGESQLAIVANAQKINLAGENIGDPLYDVRFNGNVIPRMLDPLNDATFDKEASTTHVSPVLSQSIFADMKIFDELPVFNDLHMFQNASLRLGYTVTWVGRVARPADSIHWQGFPLTPEIRTSYQDWWMHSLSAAVDWNW
jgi:hypothetical protein